MLLSEPRFWMPFLKIGLGLWQGDYSGIECPWLRWYGEEGNWILTREEQLEAQLRTLEIDPNQL